MLASESVALRVSNSNPQAPVSSLMPIARPRPILPSGVSLVSSYDGLYRCRHAHCPWFSRGGEGGGGLASYFIFCAIKGHPLFLLLFVGNLLLFGREDGVSLLACLLERLPSRHITVNLWFACLELSSVLSVDTTCPAVRSKAATATSSFHVHAMRTVVFNFAIWSRGAPDVQMRVLEHIRIMVRVLFGPLLGIIIGVAYCSSFDFMMLVDRCGSNAKW